MDLLIDRIVAIFLERPIVNRLEGQNECECECECECEY